MRRWRCSGWWAALQWRDECSMCVVPGRWCSCVDGLFPHDSKSAHMPRPRRCSLVLNLAHILSPQRGDLGDVPPRRGRDVRPIRSLGCNYVLTLPPLYLVRGEFISHYRRQVGGWVNCKIMVGKCSVHLHATLCHQHVLWMVLRMLHGVITMLLWVINLLLMGES